MYKPIFISYSRKDINRVIPFVKALEKVIGENRIWLDLSGIESGSEFEDRIIKAIDDSEIILFMISDNSMQSVSAKNEVKYAYNKNKKVLPVILDGGGLRDWFLFIFGRINFTDITDPKQVKQLEETLKKTVRTSVDTKYLELARTYLNEHPKEEMYRVSITPIEPVHDEDYHDDLLVNFTNKEVDCLRFFCEELGYPYQHLFEIKDWQEEQDIDEEHRNILIGALKKMAFDYWFWADSVVFTKTDKKYKFRMAIFPHGFDQKPEIHDFVASVKDEDYLRMLALKMSNRHLCFNDLRYYLPNAFDYISLQAEIIYFDVSGHCGGPWTEDLISVQDFVDVRKDSSYESLSLAPYAVEMTEVDEDAFTILGEPGLMECIYDGDTYDGGTLYTALNIAERVLSFRMEDERTKLIDRENIDNVNALDVQKAMNVDNYHGILDRFKLDFNGRDGVQIFKKWLDDNGINYSYNESHDVF